MIIKFIDLFAGIGGFRLGMEAAGHEAVGWCEIDKFARKSYKEVYNTDGEWTARDVRKVKPEELPEAHCYTAGFPCQSFSVAGKRGGFEDTRGTLFFEIMRIARARKPKYLLLENVKGLLNHNGGATFGTIINTMAELGYSVEWQVLNSKNFGVPQRITFLMLSSPPAFFQIFEARTKNRTSVAAIEKRITTKTPIVGIIFSPANPSVTNPVIPYTTTPIPTTIAQLLKTLIIPVPP